VWRLLGSFVFISVAAWELVEFMPLIAAANVPFWQRFHIAVAVLFMVALAVVGVRDAAAANPVSLETRVVAMFCFAVLAGYQILWTTEPLALRLVGVPVAGAVVYLMAAELRTLGGSMLARPPQGPPA
jgi:hypothetical protein